MRIRHFWSAVTLTGALATAAGSLFAGVLTEWLGKSAWAVASQRVVVYLYAAMGIVLAIVFSRLSPIAEAHREPDGPYG